LDIANFVLSPFPDNDIGNAAEVFVGCQQLKLGYYAALVPLPLAFWERSEDTARNGVHGCADTFDYRCWALLIAASPVPETFRPADHGYILNPDKRH
jgi:hypothetical protein